MERELRQSCSIATAVCPVEAGGRPGKSRAGGTSGPPRQALPYWNLPSSCLYFFFCCFALIDFARLFYVEVTLQNAIRQAGRYAITGNHLPDPKHKGQNLSRVNSIIQIAQNAAQGLDISAIQVSSLNGGAGSAGGPGDTVTISLTTDLKFMTAFVGQFFKDG